MSENLSSYQKLFDYFLLKDRPEIDHIIVRKPDFPFSVLWGIKIDVYLKPADQQESMVSCNFILGMLKGKIRELTKYVGNKINADINIYFEGELLCHDLLWGR